MTSRRSTRSRRSSTLPDGDARDVEQVVDHAREVRDLALDDAGARRVARAVAARHHLERGDDRRERIAQLVAEHREELVLRAVRDLGLAQRVARLAEQADVVERERGALRQLADERAVLVAEAAPRLGLQRAHRADRAAARDQRHDAGRAHAEVAATKRAKGRVGEALDVARLEVDEERLAGRDTPRRTSPASRASTTWLRSRTRASPPARSGSTWRVSLRCSTPSLSSRSMRQMSAMLGTITERDRRERRLLLERARQQRAGADELLQARLRPLGAGARLALGIEQQLALGLVLRAQRGGGDERIGRPPRSRSGRRRRRAPARRGRARARRRAAARSAPRCCARRATRRCRRCRATAGCRRRRRARSRAARSLRPPPGRRARPSSASLRTRATAVWTSSPSIVDVAPTASSRALRVHQRRAAIGAGGAPRSARARASARRGRSWRRTPRRSSPRERAAG